MRASSEDRIPPVRKRITVGWPPEQAFRRFTAEIAEWWPLATYSVGQERAETVVFETRLGGRIYERQRDGTEVPWGTVQVWEPPHRVVFSWHPGYGTDEAQTVEVRFHALDAGTRVEVEHRGWERRKDGAVLRGQYDSGWPVVLARFAPA